MHIYLQGKNVSIYIWYMTFALIRLSKYSFILRTSSHRHPHPRHRHRHRHHHHHHLYEHILEIDFLIISCYSLEDEEDESVI